jgi:subtilisin family serine protease
MDQTVTQKAKPATGYHYLWHLMALGVIDPDGTGDRIETTLWDKLSDQGDVKPARVAMIDVGCHFDHPNLQGRVDPERSIDFTTSPYGTRSKKHAGSTCQHNFAGLDTSLLKLQDLSQVEAEIFADIVQQLEGSSGHVRAFGDVEAPFASHGTAVSGLIVGGPENCPQGNKPTEGVIPYFGVDPFSQLISIRTGFDNDPLQFAAALLYAWHQNPDVIVMPRGFPDPDQAPAFKEDFKADLEKWENRDAADLIERLQTLQAGADTVDTKRPQLPISGRRLWRVVTSLFKAISNHVPIVCAAGNEGESQLLFPANLADRENGIIAVGAVSGNGYRSGYSNYGEGLTVVAPSDDMVVFNRHQLRSTEKSSEELGYLLPKGAKEYPFSPRWLLSTDIPGRFGYDTGDAETEELGTGSAQSGYYTQFGGTSGACALVGGVIALIRRAERIADKSSKVRDGRDVKALLIKTARKDILIDNQHKQLNTDAMNADEEDVAPFSTFFGGGLVDAKAAIETIL